MKIHELNPGNEKTILLLHPMLASAETMKTVVVPYLGADYHYLIPDFSAHGEAKVQTYESAKQEAQALYEYLQEKNFPTIHLGYGASLGGEVLMELMKHSGIHIEHYFFEGVSFHENAPMTHMLTKQIFLKKHREAQSKPALAIEKIAEIYGETIAPSMAETFIAMKEESISHIVHDSYHRTLPRLSENLQKRCTFAYGEKENNLKEFRRLQPSKYPKAEVRIWKGLEHCAPLTQNSKGYGKMLQGYIVSEKD